MLWTSVAMAQTTTFCGDLSAEDCAILEASEAAMADLNAASFTFNVDLAAFGQTGTDDFVLSVSGDGAFQMDPAVLDALPSDIPEDPMAILNIVETVVGGFAGSLNVTITSDELVMEIGTNSVTLQLVLVDGVGYINFSALDEAFGGMLAMQGLSGWGGLDLNEALAEFGPLLMMMADPEMGGMPVPDDGDIDEEQLMNLASQHGAIERVADDNGGAVFVTTFDVAGLLGDPDFVALLQTQAVAAGASPAEIAELQQLAEVGPDALTVSSTSIIDLSTNYLRSVSLDVFVDAASVSAVLDGDVEDGTLTINMNLSYADYNTATVSAPADAQIAPLDMLFGMLMGGGF